MVILHDQLLKMAPMPPNLTHNGDLSFQKSALIFFVNGKKVSIISNNIKKIFKYLNQGMI